MSSIQEQVRLHLSSLIAAKQYALKPLEELRDTLCTPDSDKGIARDFIKEICRNEDTIGREDTKELVTPVALQHNIYASVGDYGNGEELYLSDSRWSDHKRGDWVSSSEGC